MSPRDIPTPEERARLKAIGEKLKALPPERQERFEEWLTNAYARATKPKRGRGRPRAENPLSEYVSLRVSASALREMESATVRLELGNVGAYLRWLHERFIDALKLRESLK